MHSFTHDDALSTDPVFALLHLHGSDLLTSDGMQIEKSLSHHGSISCYDHSVAVAPDEHLSRPEAAGAGWICAA